MNITSVTAINLGIKTEEFAVMMTTYNYIAQLMKKLPDDSEIISTYTGEAISKDELGRVMGILDGLTNGGDWIIG